MKIEEMGIDKKKLRMCFLLLRAFLEVRIPLTYLELFSYVECVIGNGTYEKFKLQKDVCEAITELVEMNFVSQQKCIPGDENGDDLLFFPTLKSQERFELDTGSLRKGIDIQTWLATNRRNRMTGALSKQNLVETKMKSLHAYNDSRDLGYSALGRWAVLNQNSVKDVMNEEGIMLE